MADPALPPAHQPTQQQHTMQPLDIETLVAEHAAVLYRYSYRLTGQSADAEDLVQQVFLTALSKLDQLRDPAAARSWLFAVLRRAYLRVQRRPRPQPAANFEIEIDLLAVDMPPELAFDSEELQRAIDGLPDEYKLVLVGFYFEDCSYKDLAERLELPIGTVMSRLSRAKGHLRAQLLGRQGENNERPSRMSYDSKEGDSHSGNSQSGNSADAATRLRGEAR